jgi:hypothetical protein
VSRGLASQPEHFGAYPQASALMCLESRAAGCGMQGATPIGMAFCTVWVSAEEMLVHSQGSL